MMAAGIPCIVADVDAFSELPDDAVVKLKPGTEIGKNSAPDVGGVDPQTRMAKDVIRRRSSLYPVSG